MRQGREQMVRPGGCVLQRPPTGRRQGTSKKCFQVCETERTIITFRSWYIRVRPGHRRNSSPCGCGWWCSSARGRPEPIRRRRRGGWVYYKGRTGHQHIRPCHRHQPIGHPSPGRRGARRRGRARPRDSPAGAPPPPAPRKGWQQGLLGSPGHTPVVDVELVVPGCRGQVHEHLQG